MNECLDTVENEQVCRLSEHPRILAHQWCVLGEVVAGHQAQFGMRRNVRWRNS